MKYIILSLSRNAYWTQNQYGYVQRIEDAGRFDLATATRIVTDANRVSIEEAMIPVDEGSYDLGEVRMSTSEWAQALAKGRYTPEDGKGYWMNPSVISDVSCFDPRPSWATSVIWFNK